MARMQNRERLNRKLAALPGEVRSAIRQALAESADEITDMQRRLVPVDSGDLRNSIGSTFGKYQAENPNVRGVAAGGSGDPDLSVTIHAGDAKAFYAAFVEFGTAPHEQPDNPLVGYKHPGAKARPFFYPAYRALKKRVKSRINRATRQAARKVAAGS